MDFKDYNIDDVIALAKEKLAESIELQEKMDEFANSSFRGMVSEYFSKILLGYLYKEFGTTGLRKIAKATGYKNVNELMFSLCCTVHDYSLQPVVDELLKKYPKALEC